MTEGNGKRKPDRDTWICKACDWEGQDTEIRKEEVFAATREEPSEWEWYCPDCNKSESLEEKFEGCAWCTTCENEIVQDEGEQCWECQVSNAEMLADRAKGH